MSLVVLKGAVGAHIKPKPNAVIPNDYNDQILVTGLLYLIPASEGGSLGELMPLLTGHQPSDQLAERIWIFQQHWLNILNADDPGVVRPGSATLRLLESKAPVLPSSQPFSSGTFDVEVMPEGYGDGRIAGTAPFVQPSSLFSGGPRSLTSPEAPMTIRLVSVKRGATRFWFGIAVPEGCQTFDRAHVYFHPTAKVETYPDKDYQDFTGNWRYLHKNNIHPVARQVVAALKMPLIVPYMRNAAAASAALNPFSHGAADILNAVMSACARVEGSGFIGKMKITALSLSSFSYGINYMLPSLQWLKPTGMVREIIDLDSSFIKEIQLRLLPGMAPRTLVISQVDQNVVPWRIMRDAPWWGESAELYGMFATHQSIFNQALFPALHGSALKTP